LSQHPSTWWRVVRRYRGPFWFFFVVFAAIFASANIRDLAVVGWERRFIVVKVNPGAMLCTVAAGVLSSSVMCILFWLAKRAAGSRRSPSKDYPNQ
jgi:hypothetical protein